MFTNNSEKDLGVIDYETGEEVGILKPGDSFFGKRSRDYLQRTIELNKEVPFIKLFISHDFTLAKELNGIETTMLMYLCNFISYESCAIMYNNGIFLNTNHISENLGISENYIYKIMTKLVQKQTIARCKTGRKTFYIMNPYIFQKGKRVNKTLHKMFKHTKWATRFN